MNNEVLLSNIRDLCKKSNITVAGLEKKMGMGAGTISRWNKANPSFDKIVAIAKFFKVSIDFLSGYTVETDSEEEPDEKTVQIIEYLRKMTVVSEESESFWHDYQKNNTVELMVSDLPGWKADLENYSCDKQMGKLLYAGDDTGYYLLQINYLLNACYDYETKIYLYLVPDETTVPIMECSNKSMLQTLYIEAFNHMERFEAQKTAKEKVDMQKDKILKKYQELNE